MNQLNSTLKVWASSMPYSTDPMEYDKSIHHISFTSVNASVVTQYKKGSIIGILLDSWEPAEDYTTWRLKVSRRMTFNNGDPITADIIYKNWMRIAYLMKINKSNSGLLEHLVDFDKITNPSSKIRGLSFSDNYIVLHFSRPIPDFIPKISFGLYSIVHPSNFSASDGRWIETHSPITSGPYEIEEWTDQALKLKLRTDYPRELIHSSPFNKILIRDDQDQMVVEESDVVFATSESLAINHRFKFYGPLSANIVYLECHSYEDPLSPCSSKIYRATMRNAFYKYIEDEDKEIVRSFVPLSVNGTKQSEDDLIKPSDSSPEAYRKIIWPKYLPTLNSSENLNRQSSIEIYSDSLQKMATALKLKGESVPFNHNDRQNMPKFDFTFIMTGLRIDSPNEDIRFMIQSKEGIKLPDPTGRLHNLVSTAEFKPQEINEILWDDAIVWPLNHLSHGMWIKEDRVQVSELNIALPPTSFDFFGVVH